jgi:hypothetical protein
MDGDYTPEPVNLNNLVVPVVLSDEPEVITNHWYNAWSGATKDFIESAQKNADVTGHVQRIHFHSSTQECGAFEHMNITPDPRRRAALTR